MPISKIVFWGGFGAAVNLWRLGLEMQPLFGRRLLWTYPVFIAVGSSFGYWIQGVDQRQRAMMVSRKTLLLEKRERQAAREAAAESA